jgi:ubiquinone/menaquinone biosynthesis C-methylase UbiE
VSNPAETYESYMVPALFAPWASRLIESAKPKPGERVLDVACGTGVVARRVASIVGSEGKAVGLDANPNMLDVARTMAKQERLRVQWHEARAESLPFPEGSFDLVTCQFALMFFEDRHAALTEMYRVLTPEGRLALSVWQSFEQHPFYRRLDEAIEHHAGLSGVRDIFAIGDSTEVRRLVLDAGFTHVQIESASMTARFPDPVGFLAGEIDVDTAAIPSMQHLDANARAAIAREIAVDMQDTLRDVTVGDQVVLPFHAHLVSATRGGPAAIHR